MQKHSLNRRELLSGAAAAGLATVAGSAALAASDSPSRVTGIQLYTVRDAMAKDVLSTLQAIAGIGYREVEFAGYFDHTARQVREMLDGFGLVSPSSHMDARALRDDAQPLLDTAAAIGHDYVTIAWLLPEDRRTIDDYRRWSDDFNRIGEKCRDHGLRLAYHNHDFEFVEVDGEIPFDVIMENTDAGLVDFELDFFWVRKGGRAVLDVVGQAPERFTMAHIKDMDVDGNMVDVGSGTIDFAAILGDPAAAPIRHCFVEHDSPADPFQSVAYSHYSLKNILD